MRGLPPLSLHRVADQHREPGWKPVVWIQTGGLWKGGEAGVLRWIKSRLLGRRVWSAGGRGSQEPALILFLGCSSGRVELPVTEMRKLRDQVGEGELEQSGLVLLRGPQPPHCLEGHSWPTQGD